MCIKIIDIKENIREVEIENLKTGADNSIPFTSENKANKPLFALEILYFDELNLSETLKKIYENDFQKRLLLAQNSDCDIISIKFNITEKNFDEQFAQIKSGFKNIFKTVSKPLILRGTNNIEIDKKLLKFFAIEATKPVIIASVNENSYEEIVPEIIKKNHILVLKSPIDINLAKELNILSIDMGLSPAKILIDPDTGGLGYGFEYGYSMIEKIRHAGLQGDLMLNMPIISFSGEEIFKAKELKSDTFSFNWGEIEKRAIFWEITAAIALINAGVNIIVMWNAQALKEIKRSLWN